MRKIIAKYQIQDTFRITGRGIVLTGLVLEGTITIGNSIEFTFNGQKLKRNITGIEGVRAVSEKTNTGLLIECNDVAEIDDLSNWIPNLKIGNIYSNK